MEIAITDMLHVGQLVWSRSYDDVALFSSDGQGRRGIVVEINPVDDAQVGHVVKVLWQDTGEVEGMPDWFAAELLEPIALVA